MIGQKNLKEVLNSLQVSCDNVKYGFATVPSESDISLEDVLGTFKENEGLTVIASIDYFTSKHISFEGPFVKLTIDVHTSLELVGLTAAFATKLAEKNIPTNVIAGHYHDHIFVQHELRDQAMAALSELKK